ncbi:MAG TPA: histidine kinase [Phnomibacter sp.]|nr:histidine kinase [Phnomibacter sp.]
MLYKLLLLLMVCMPGPLLAADTIFIANKLMLMLPGIGKKNMLEGTQEFVLYKQQLQIQMVLPKITTKGTVEWWGDLEEKYWEQPWEMGIAAGQDKPQLWRSLKLGSKALDTNLVLGSKLFIWIRANSKAPPTRLFVISRPVMQPQLKGYQMLPVTDTGKLGWRVQMAIQQKGQSLAFHPLKGLLPELPPGHTAEILLESLAGLPDSSLEYRLEVGADTLMQSRWQATGHLLRLPPLQPGESYRLQIRYQGMPVQVSLGLRVGRPWYQQPRWQWIPVLAGMLLVGLFFYLRYRKRIIQIEQRHRALQDKLQLLHSQLNPHFLYNALSSIAGLVSMQQYDKANIYLTEFGHLLREVIKYSQLDRSYSLREELQMLERYCQLEQMRFGFQYSIHYSPSLSPSEVLLPPLLVQPLVENAILHGAQALQEKGEITISYLQQGSDFEVRVTDNGPGVHEQKLHNGFGLGLNNTRERIKYISHLISMEISFSLTRENDLSVATIHFYKWFE